MTFTSATLGGNGNWSALTPSGSSLAALAMSFSTRVNCGAPWLSATPVSGTATQGETDTTTITANAAALSVGNYRGFVCVDSNGADADEPQVAVPFALEVAPVDDRLFQDGFQTP